MKKTLSGLPGELDKYMEYWVCPSHRRIQRIEFEIRLQVGEYYAFHRHCGMKLKALDYVKAHELKKDNYELFLKEHEKV